MKINKYNLVAIILLLFGTVNAQDLLDYYVQLDSQLNSLYQQIYSKPETFVKTNIISYVGKPTGSGTVIYDIQSKLHYLKFQKMEPSEKPYVGLFFIIKDVNDTDGHKNKFDKEKALESIKSSPIPLKIVVFINETRSGSDVYTPEEINNLPEQGINFFEVHYWNGAITYKESELQPLMDFLEKITEKPEKLTPTPIIPTIIPTPTTVPQQVISIPAGAIKVAKFGNANFENVDTIVLDKVKQALPKINFVEALPHAPNDKIMIIFFRVGQRPADQDEKNFIRKEVLEPYSNIPIKIVILVGIFYESAFYSFNTSELEAFRKQNIYFFNVIGYKGALSALRPDVIDFNNTAINGIIDLLGKIVT